MCDEAKLKQWAQDALSRRQFGVLVGAAAVTACVPGEASERSQGEKSDVPAGLVESPVSFETADGTMDALFVHPAEGKHPAIIFWPDIASIREAKRNMARRLAVKDMPCWYSTPIIATSRVNNSLTLLPSSGVRDLQR